MWMLVVGIILLLLVLLAILPLGIRLVYEDDFYLYAYIWKLRIRLMPRKKKTVRVRSYTARARARREKRMQRRQVRKSRRAAKKQAQKEKTPAKKPAGRKRRSLGETVDFVRRLGTLVLALLLKFVGYAKLEIARLIVIVGTGDAAETAKLYGMAEVAVTNAIGVLDEFVTSKVAEQEIMVRADFLAESSTICCDIRLQLRVWHVIVLGVKGLLGFLQCKTASTKKQST